MKLRLIHEHIPAHKRKQMFFTSLLNLTVALLSLPLLYHTFISQQHSAFILLFSAFAFSVFMVYILANHQLNYAPGLSLYILPLLSMQAFSFIFEGFFLVNGLILLAIAYAAYTLMCYSYRQFWQIIANLAYVLAVSVFLLLINKAIKNLYIIEQAGNAWYYYMYGHAIVLLVVGLVFHAKYQHESEGCISRLLGESGQLNQTLTLAMKQNSRQQVKNLIINEQMEAQRRELEKAFKQNSAQQVKLTIAHEKIQEQNQALEQANKEILESTRLKEIFLANTSHEIRTPLNAILGFTNLLLGQGREGKDKEYLQFIKNSGDNLLVIINDILDFSKIEAGKLEIEDVDFDIRQLVDNLVKTMRVKAREKDISLTRHVDKNIPPALKGDPTRISQVLINLVGNSLKFTDEDGLVQVNLKIEEKQGGNCKLLIQVKDNGIGIAQDKQATVFESFSQAESHTTRKYGGTGLGLTIVKRLTELMGGSIGLESQEGKGTTFFIELPMKEGDVQMLESDETKVATTSIDNEVELLIVEDNPLNMQLAQDVISNWSDKVRIDKAYDGKEAIEKSLKQVYDLILMDLSLPGMDGYAITGVIRKRGNKNHKTPIIAMTAHAMSSEREKSHKAGMNGFLTKPFEPEDLYATISRYGGGGQTPQKRYEAQARESTKKEDAPIGGSENVNISYLERIYGGAKDKIIKMVKMYLEAIPEEIEQVQANHEAKDWQALSIAAHSLKPKMLYIGLKSMQKTALEIEKMAENEEGGPLIKERINTLIDRWLQAEKELIAILDKLIGNQ